MAKLAIYNSYFAGTVFNKGRNNNYSDYPPLVKFDALAHCRDNRLLYDAQYQLIRLYYFDVAMYWYWL